MPAIDGPQHIRDETVITDPAPATATWVEPTAGRVELMATPAGAARVRTSSVSRFEPDALVAAAVGLVVVVVGLIAIARGGFAGVMSDPVVEVLGFAHTTVLGLIEIGIGAALLIAGASRSRSGGMFFGTVLGIAGFVGAVQTSSFERNLALESSMGWLAAVAGAAVVAAAMLLPRFARRSTIVDLH